MFYNFLRCSDSVVNWYFTEMSCGNTSPKNMSLNLVEICSSIEDKKNCLWEIDRPICLSVFWQWLINRLKLCGNRSLTVSDKGIFLYKVSLHITQKHGDASTIKLYLLTYLLTYLLAYLPTYLLTYIYTFLLTYLLAYLLSYLLAYLLTYWLTDLLTYLLTYLLAYLLT